MYHYRYKGGILALVLAGGRGGRLHPLTAERTKPSVPFGGKYRIIDFALSNLVNSGIYSIYVLVQYKSQSLIEHIRTTWRRGGVLPRHFITVVPPQMRKEGIQEWYRGTADSVYQNINLIYDFKPKFVAIFGGDHVYRMNIKEMIEYHVKRKAKVTVSVLPVKTKYSGSFGVVDVDSSSRVKGFTEKPSVFEDKEYIYASMGNYIFNTDVLIDMLEENAQKITSHDFGKDILPSILEKDIPLYAYDFTKNKIPNTRRYEEKSYWRDVGTIQNYWESNMDLLGIRPKLDLSNQVWNIYASNLASPPAYIVNSSVNNSLICEGSKISGAEIKDSILGRGVIVEKGCKINKSIIMDFTHIKSNCTINKTIIDRCNTIKKNESIGVNKDKDKEKYFVDSSGIVVLRRGGHRNSIS